MVDPLLSAFGARLRSVRHQAGLSQERLAEQAGFDRTYISLLELGKRAPSLIGIGRLARALGVDPADLLAGVPADPSAEEESGASSIARRTDGAPS